MTQKEFNQYLNEFHKIYTNQDNDNIVIEAAFFIEDVFNIILSDDEINTTNLASYNAMKKFLTTRKQLEDTCVESAE